MSAEDGVSLHEQDQLGPEISHILSRAGDRIENTGTRLRISSDQVLHFTNVPSNPLVLDALKSYIFHIVETRSPRYASGCLARLSALSSSYVGSTINSDIEKLGFIGTRSYRAFEKENLRQSDDTRNLNLGTYVRWYNWCCDTGDLLFDEDVATALARIEFPGNTHGEAVLRRDPNCGPLTDGEFHQVVISIMSAAASNKIDSKVLLTSWLLLSFGTNPLNIRLIHEEDYLKTPLEDGSVLYQIRIPRIKKRTSNPRGQFRTRQIDPQIASLIEAVIERNALTRAEFKDVVESPHKFLLSTDKPRSELLGTTFENWAFQQNSSWPGQALRSIVEKLSLKNGRNEVLHLTPRRLRYTFATNLVDEGADPIELADALDHSSTHHVHVYFNSREKIVGRLDAALEKVAPALAAGFLGKIISSPGLGDEEVKPESVIRHYSPGFAAVRSVGTCGTKSACDLPVPIACYVCRAFQPWMEADHHAVLREELRKRADKKEKVADSRWLGIHDHSIQAIRAVVARCDELKAAKP